MKTRFIGLVENRLHPFLELFWRHDLSVVSSYYPVNGRTFCTHCTFRTRLTA
jgi:hypothetical protein